MSLNQIRSKYFPCVSLLWALLVANPMLMRVLLFSGKPFLRLPKKMSPHPAEPLRKDKIAPCGRKKSIPQKGNRLIPAVNRFIPVPKRMCNASAIFSPSGDILNYILSSLCLPVGCWDCLLGALKAHKETSTQDYQGWLQARPTREDIKKYFDLFHIELFILLPDTNIREIYANSYLLTRAPETVNVPLAVSITRRPFKKNLRAF